MSLFSSEVQVGDIDVARHIFGIQIRLAQWDDLILIPAEDIKPLIEALLYVQEKL